MASNTGYTFHFLGGFVKNFFKPKNLVKLGIVVGASILAPGPGTAAAIAGLGSLGTDLAFEGDLNTKDLISAGISAASAYAGSTKFGPQTKPIGGAPGDPTLNTTSSNWENTWNTADDITQAVPKEVLEETTKSTVKGQVARDYTKIIQVGADKVGNTKLLNSIKDFAKDHPVLTTTATGALVSGVGSSIQASAIEEAAGKTSEAIKSGTQLQVESSERIAREQIASAEKLAREAAEAEAARIEASAGSTRKFLEFLEKSYEDPLIGDVPLLSAKVTLANRLPGLLEEFQRGRRDIKFELKPLGDRFTQIFDDIEKGFFKKQKEEMQLAGVTGTEVEERSLRASQLRLELEKEKLDSEFRLAENVLAGKVQQSNVLGSEIALTSQSIGTLAQSLNFLPEIGNQQSVLARTLAGDKTSDIILNRGRSEQAALSNFANVSSGALQQQTNLLSQNVPVSNVGTSIATGTLDSFLAALKREQQREDAKQRTGIFNTQLDRLEALKVGA